MLDLIILFFAITLGPAVIIQYIIMFIANKKFYIICDLYKKEFGDIPRLARIFYDYSPFFIYGYQSKMNFITSPILKKKKDIFSDNYQDVKYINGLPKELTKIFVVKFYFGIFLCLNLAGLGIGMLTSYIYKIGMVEFNNKTKIFFFDNTLTIVTISIIVVLFFYSKSLSKSSLRNFKIICHLYEKEILPLPKRISDFLKTTSSTSYLESYLIMSNFISGPIIFKKKPEKANEKSVAFINNLPGKYTNIFIIIWLLNFLIALLSLFVIFINRNGIINFLFY